MRRALVEDVQKVLVVVMVAILGILFVDSAGLGGQPVPVRSPEDVLFLRSSGGITLVPTAGGGDAVTLRRAVPSTDWSAVVRADRRETVTRVTAHDSATGALLWSQEVPGKLEAKVASAEAELVALGAPRGGTGYPAGRSSSTLVIAGDGSEPRTIELAGNYEPEAFSTDGQSLFLIEYLPPEDPTQYRVRRLDLRTEEVLGVYSVDAHLQEAMGGTARVQAASPDGRRLYTLYTLDGPDGAKHAFVHVLALDELWAHCVDLPLGFGTASEKAIALSVSPDGRRLYAVDTSAGTVAEVDAQTLAVTRTTGTELGSRGGTAHAARGADGKLYLGRDTRLMALDASTLALQRSWDLEGRITGIQAGSDGERLYVGLKNQILVLDPTTGRTLNAIDPETRIEQFGRSMRSLDPERRDFECAC